MTRKVSIGGSTEMEDTGALSICHEVVIELPKRLHDQKNEKLIKHRLVSW